MDEYRLTADDLPEEPLRPATMEEQFDTVQRMHDRVEEQGLSDPWSAGLLCTSYIQHVEDTIDEYGEQVFINVVHAIFWPTISDDTEVLEAVISFLVERPPSTATDVQYATGREDVAYFGFFEPVDEDLTIPDSGALLEAEAVFTMVRDAVSGVWRPWAFGDMLNPEEIPASPTMEPV